jgi:hypothetical protein
LDGYCQILLERKNIMHKMTADKIAVVEKKAVVYADRT